MTDPTSRNAVRRSGLPAGPGVPVIVFAHGFGCDQTMWDQVAPRFEETHHVVLYDLTGSGSSDLSAYDQRRHGTLQGHADDLAEVLESLGIEDVTIVGHSVSAMIGALAAISAPTRIGRLVMVAPTPCYLEDGDYHGGFPREDLHELIEAMDENYVSWAHQLAGVVNGPANDEAHSADLGRRFCATDHQIARHFARVTFLSDHRAEMPKVAIPTLILQCSDDAVAPVFVGDWLRRAIPQSDLTQLRATGHCPHVTAPEETTNAIRRYLAS